VPALCIVLGGVAVPAGASGDALQLVTATVYERDGTIDRQEGVTTDDLGHDPGGCPTYTGTNLVEHGGAAGQGLSVDEPASTPIWPMWSILACLGPKHVVPGDVTSVVVYSNGAPETDRVSRLTHADLAIDPDTGRGTSDFDDDSQSPIVVTRGSSFDYHRPWRGGDDQNYADRVYPTGSPLVIDVYTGDLLDVTLTATPGSVHAGGTVTLRASLPVGAGRSYTWTSGDGTTWTTSQPSTTYQYTSGGDYTATVEVEDGHGGGGAGKAPVDVEANDTQAQPTPTPSATPPPRGPDRGAPGHSPGHTPGHTRRPGQAKGGGKARSPGSGAHEGERTPTDHGRRPTPTATAAPSPAGRSAGSGGGAPSRDRGAPGGAKPETRRRTRRTRTPDSGLERVSGRLVSDVIALPAGASPLVRRGGAPQGSAQQERRQVDGGSLPAVIGALLGVAALLGLGAARELDVLPRVRA
jgi:hypothetical protein